MRLSTRTHAIVDYLIAASLVASPWVLGFGARGPETWLPVGVGAVILFYSLVTQYELAAVRRLDVPLHLWLDGIAGVLVAASPWLFAFEDQVWAPHLSLGLLLIAVALFTHTIPGFERRRSGAGAEAG